MVITRRTVTKSAGLRYCSKNGARPSKINRKYELGGLAVIGTERHEARRIDNQLRGRSGRLGDPGISRFYLSLEDELMRRFGGDRISGDEYLGVEDDIPIGNWAGQPGD